MELARSQALEAIDRAAAMDADGDRTRASHVRQKASRLLYRLAPGKCGSIGAISCGSGALTADAANMAKVLNQHWGDIFKARGVDEEKLRTWIAEDVELRRVRGELQADMAKVRLQRTHVANAVRHSNNSSLVQMVSLTPPGGA